MARTMSACGVWCSECPAYLGNAKGLAHQKQTADAWRRIYRLKVAPEGLSCGGCQGSDAELFYMSRSCKARRCCRRRELSSCAECRRVACLDLEKAQTLWDGVPGLASTLSPGDFRTYARPYCGHRQRLAAARAARRPHGARRG